MRTYEITADKKLRMTEGDTTIVTTGRILFIVAEGTEYLVANALIPGHTTLVDAFLINSLQVNGVVQKNGVLETVTLTWDRMLLDDGKSYNRPGFVASTDKAA